jgi:Xaa-Pro dipeptidase
MADRALNRELEEKTERLRRMLASEGLGGVLINAQHNFAWLTGGRSNVIDVSRDNGASNLLVRVDGKRFVIANNIEMPRLLAEEIDGSDFEPVEIKWEDEKSSPNFVIDIARSLVAEGELAADIPPNNDVRAAESLISTCRYELTVDEIDRFRQLGADAGMALGDVVAKLEPGETEIEVARKVRDEFASHGIYSVVTLVGSDERIAKFRHPIPTDSRWKNTLLIAVCARRQGLIASLSRIVCAAVAPSELERRTEAVAMLNAQMYSATQPGTTGAELYTFAAKAYTKQGFSGEIGKHHQGGACGYRTRDWVAHPKSTETVRMNQAFAWNPSITGTKVEETGIVTASGFEVITATNGFPQIAVSVNGREYLSPGILSLSKGLSLG